MRKSLVLAAVLAACTVSFPVSALADGAPRLKSEAEKSPRPADQALRDAMTALRELLAAQVADGGVEKLSDDEHVALADEIDRRVAAVVAGRDFHSREGRHLQWMLGDISDGADLMRTAPRAQAKRLGLLRVVETLNYYGREYDHPGWTPLHP
jgi:hypothetical protein